MRYTALHGSPGPWFNAFDPARSGSMSGYDHAVGVACFTSELEVARHYAQGEGFVGRFAFHLENPLEVDEAERCLGFPSLLRQARENGHDGVIVRACNHDGVSPGMASDVYFVFDFTAPRLIETVQEGPEPTPEPPTRAVGAGRRR